MPAFFAAAAFLGGILITLSIGLVDGGLSDSLDVVNLAMFARVCAGGNREQGIKTKEHRFGCAGIRGVLIFHARAIPREEQLHLINAVHKYASCI